MFDEREVLSALVDREPVDAEVLGRVLEGAANRALLVDMIRLRACVLADDDIEAEALAPSVPTVSRRHLTRTWMRVAAIVLLCVVTAGGGMWVERYLAGARPPNPSRTVVMDPVSIEGGQR